jgi:hypothetical protein
MRVVRLVVTLVAVFQFAGQPVAAQTDDPAAVVDAFQRAQSDGNLDQALLQFADNAVVAVQGMQAQTFIGRDQVRVYLQTIGLEFQPIMRSSPRVEGARVSWTERDQGTTQTVDAEVQVIVFSGRIISMLYRTGTPFGVASQAAAEPDRTRELPSAAWPVGLAIVGIGLVALLSRRPRAAPSQLDGRLLTRMRHFRADAGERKAA